MLGSNLTRLINQYGSAPTASYSKKEASTATTPLPPLPLPALNTELTLPEMQKKQSPWSSRIQTHWGSDTPRVQALRSWLTHGSTSARPPRVTIGRCGVRPPHALLRMGNSYKNNHKNSKIIIYIRPFFGLQVWERGRDTHSTPVSCVSHLTPKSKVYIYKS